MREWEERQALRAVLLRCAPADAVEEGIRWFGVALDQGLSLADARDVAGIVSVSFEVVLASEGWDLEARRECAQALVDLCAQQGFAPFGARIEVLKALYEIRREAEIDAIPGWFAREFRAPLAVIDPVVIPAQETLRAKSGWNVEWTVGELYPAVEAAVRRWDWERRAKRSPIAAALTKSHLV